MVEDKQQQYQQKQVEMEGVRHELRESLDRNMRLEQLLILLQDVVRRCMRVDVWSRATSAIRYPPCGAALNAPGSAPGT